jgi:peptidyl-tRNA hydrolase
MSKPARLFLVTRRDLHGLAGPKIAQCAHALRDFAARHPERDRRWFENGNHLVVLEVADEAELQELRARAAWFRVPHGWFEEPDLSGALTALAVDEVGAKLVRKLPLVE